MPSTRIDIVVEKIEDNKKHEDLFDDYFNNVNIIEFKSFWESLNIKEVYKAIGKYLLFLSETKNKIEHTSLFFIVTHKPQKLLKSKFFEYADITMHEAGVYKTEKLVGNADIYIIVINNLNVEDRTLQLLKFSKGGAKQTFINFLLNNINDEKYKRVLLECYMIDPQETIEMSKGKVTQLVTVNDNIRYAIDAIGIEKVIDAVGLEKVIDAVGFYRVFNEIDITKLQKALKKDYKEGRISKERLVKFKKLFSEILDEK